MNELENTHDTLRAFGSIFLGVGIATIAGALLSRFAFSRGIRQQILERDNFQCVRCGGTDHLEAAHSPTHKKDAGYNTVERGITLDAKCHYLDHVENHGKNGLSKKQNEWSINQIWNRLSDEERADAIAMMYPR